MTRGGLLAGRPARAGEELRAAAGDVGAITEEGRRRPFPQRETRRRMPKRGSGQAQVFANRAIRAEPTLGEPYWTLVRVSLARKQFTETTKLLTVLEKNLGVELPELMHLSEFAEFIQSSQYSSWIANRPGSIKERPPALPVHFALDLSDHANSRLGFGGGPGKEPSDDRHP